MINSQRANAGEATSEELRLRVAAELSVALSRSVPRKLAKLKCLLAIFPRVKSGAACLEVGTSHGGLTTYFAGAGKWSYVEPNPHRVAVAKQVLRGEFFTGDARDYLRAAKRHFDLIVSIDTLEHFADMGEILRLFSAAMPATGELVVAGVENREDWLYRLRSYYRLDSHTGYHHKLNAEQMASYLVAAGFVVKRRELFCGPFTELLQTLLDIRQLNDSAQGDSFTQELQDDAPALRRLLFLSRLLRVVSCATIFLDGLLPRRWRYGYILVASRAK